jgi:hypothetical protein
MSNVVALRLKPKDDEVPAYELDPTLEYDELEPCYIQDGIRLAIVVEKGDRPTPFYLVLHDGTGGHAICLRRWSPLEVDSIGSAELSRQAFIAARGFDHAVSHGLLMLKAPDPASEPPTEPIECDGRLRRLIRLVQTRVWRIPAE